MKKILNLIRSLITILVIFALPMLLIIVSVPLDLLYSMDHRLDIIALGISIYSLEMSIVIAFLIYWLQSKDSQKEEANRKEKARCMMYSELENALEGAYMRAAGCGSIGTGVSTKDIMNTYLVELQDILTPNQFRLLINLVNKIDVEANDSSEDEYRSEAARNELINFMHPWMVIIMQTSYAKYFAYVQDYHDTLSKSVFELLQVLGGTNISYQERNEIYDVKGNVLFRCKGHMEYQLYDGEGKLLLNGRMALDIYDKYSIYDGYECSETYDGYYKAGKYSGKGILYSYELEKLKEGIWEEGELFKGIEYNCLYEKQTDGSWEFCEPYRGYIDPFFSVTVYMDADEMERYCVIDDYIDGESIERKNIRTLKDFFEHLQSE